MPGPMTTYTNLPENLKTFLINLSTQTREHPALHLDLSKPSHTGFLRVLDVTKKDGTAIADGERVYDVGETGPDGQIVQRNLYKASERYAFAPGKPAAIEDDPAAAQCPITVNPDGSVETTLTVDEMNVLFDNARQGTLCATVQNGSLYSTAHTGYFYVFQAGDDGSVEIKHSTDIYNKTPEERTDNERRIIEGSAALNAAYHDVVSEAFLSKSDFVVQTALANSFFLSSYWTARYHDQPILSAEQIRDGLAFGDLDQAYFQIKRSPVEELGRLTVNDNGELRPLFDVEMLRQMDDGSDRLDHYVNSRLMDAMKTGGVFRTGSDGRPERLFITENPETGRLSPRTENMDAYRTRRSVPLYMTIARLFKKNAFQKDIDEIRRHNVVADNLDGMQTYFNDYESRQAKASLIEHGVMDEYNNVLHAPLVPQKQNGITYLYYGTKSEQLIENEKAVVQKQAELRQAFMHKLMDNHAAEVNALDETQRAALDKNVDRLTYRFARTDVNMKAWLAGGDEKDGMRYSADDIASYEAFRYVNVIAKKDGDIVSALTAPDFADQLTQTVKCTESIHSLMNDNEGKAKEMHKAEVKQLTEEASANKLTQDLIKEMPAARRRYAKLQKDDTGFVSPKDIHVVISVEKAKAVGDEQSVVNAGGKQPAAGQLQKVVGKGKEPEGPAAVF